jgi:hypothetical protein
MINKQNLLDEGFFHLNKMYQLISELNVASSRGDGDGIDEGYLDVSEGGSGA